MWFRPNLCILYWLPIIIPYKYSYVKKNFVRTDDATNDSEETAQPSL